MWLDEKSLDLLPLCLPREENGGPYSLSRVLEHATARR